ncbi:MAG: radical SAM protein [bacterium]|nr:radical SAM protein [bacterium]
MKNYNVSKYLHFQPVEEGMYVGWNRYFPSVFILNDTASAILDDIRDKKELEAIEGMEDFLAELLKYKFIYEGSEDPSRKDFLEMAANELVRVKKNLENFYQQGKPYHSLSIAIDECNLDCHYCVNQYKRRHQPVKAGFAEKLKRIENCVDQFFSRLEPVTKPAKESEKVPVKERVEAGLEASVETSIKGAGDAAAETAVEPAEETSGKNKVKEDDGISVFFNGGEILLAWDLLKQTVERIAEKYKKYKIDFGLNTNMTLMTEEMAEFLNRYDFKVSISIDGYEESHNRTRKYFNQKGSYNDIMEGLKIYKKCNPEKPIISFQGTIGSIDGFQPEKVYELESRDFVTARLAPNLLNTTEKDGLEKARVMGELLQLNTKHKLQVTELFFTNAKNIINREAFRFSYNCPGLSCVPTIGINLNVSTQRLSNLCSFVPAGTLSLKEMDYDIYNPKLGKHSYEYVKERTDALLKNCADCELIGVCCGGCIYSGLDNENELNKAACAYQKEMWKIYLKKAYNESKEEEKKESTKESA